MGEDDDKKENEAKIEEIEIIENKAEVVHEVEPKVNERTRLEELKEIMDDWINYNFNEHESEEECWCSREKMIKIQEEKQVSLEEWNTIWSMFEAKQRRLEIEEIEEENELRRNLQNDGVRAKYLQVEKSVQRFNRATRFGCSSK